MFEYMMWFYLLIFIAIVFIAYIFYRKTYVGGYFDDLPSDVLYKFMERPAISAKDYISVSVASNELFNRLIGKSKSQYPDNEKEKQFLESKKEQIFIMRIMKDPYAIKEIPEPGEKVQMAAVKMNPTLIEHITDPTDNVKRYVVQIYPHALKRYPKVFSKTPSQELVDIATKASVGSQVDVNGKQSWYKEDKLHRDDGPAVIWPNGDQRWFKEGKLHRDDGPAVISANGVQGWYKEGKLHRDDGPAVISANGKQSWYKEDKKYTEEEFKKKSSSTAPLSASSIVKLKD